MISDTEKLALVRASKDLTSLELIEATCKACRATFITSDIARAERKALEAELLKLKQGVAANSDYIQGRWDLIGEFQDIIRARGEA
jgi:hypothetical protein